MIPVDVLLLFFVSSVALALAPGPDNIFVLTLSALRGRSAGILVTLGLCTGLIFHTAAVALGVAAIFKTSAIAFNALKIVGAAYLVYLAWMSFRAGASEIEENKEDKLTSRQLYFRGVVMNITNPKVAIFFLALLPQFADPARGPLTMQIVLLGLTFIVSALMVFSSIAWAAGFLGDWIQRSKRTQVIMNRVAGTVFAGLALRLITSTR